MASRLVSSGLQVLQLDYKFEPRHPLSYTAHTHPMKSWILDMGGMMTMTITMLKMMMKMMTMMMTASTLNYKSSPLSGTQNTLFELRQ